MHVLSSRVTVSPGPPSLPSQNEQRGPPRDFLLLSTSRCDSDGKETRARARGGRASNDIPGSFGERETKRGNGGEKGIERRVSPRHSERPYRRAGSPACTARVCRFSHRRTTTAATTDSPSSSLPPSLPTLLPNSPARLLPPSGALVGAAPRQPVCALHTRIRSTQRTNASYPEKAHLSQPHLTPLRPLRLPFSSSSFSLSLLRAIRPTTIVDEQQQLRAQARSKPPYSLRGLQESKKPSPCAADAGRKGRATETASTTRKGVTRDEREEGGRASVRRWCRSLLAALLRYYCPRNLDRIAS